MIRLIIKSFIKDFENCDAADVRIRYGLLCGIVGLICNFLLFIFKLSIGVISGSLSIMADSFNNLSDFASSFLSLLGFHMSSKPADAEHPFGHARYEYLSSLAVSALMLSVGFEFALTSVKRIINPESIVFSRASVAVLVMSVLVKLWMSRFYKYAGDKINSTALKASVQDSLNDVVTTLGVLTAIVIEGISGIKIDGIAGLLVAFWILYGSFGILREVISLLLGEAADPQLIKNLSRSIVGFDPRIIGIHDLMVHDYGPGNRFATVHVEIDANENNIEAHELIDDIERMINKDYGIHLLIHYDPIVRDDDEANRARRIIKNYLFVTNPRIKIHDFRLDRHRELPCVVFDMVLPNDMSGKEEELKNDISERLKSGGIVCGVDITFDTQNFNKYITRRKDLNRRN